MPCGGLTAKSGLTTSSPFVQRRIRTVVQDGSGICPLRICYRAWLNWRFGNAHTGYGANRLAGFGKWADGPVHDQPRRLQGRHPIAEIANILSQKAGAHFLLPASEVKMIPVTKRSARYAKIVKFC
jgi:hypothetical protein